ncbi:hypothetical protein B2I21_11030 [Chryseobacterium mucoviscidosis]|nr:hypothetical protein B2I21_11030 [Chryseobacterium mucoviscidosis]
MGTINVLHLSDLHFGMETHKEETMVAKRKNALNGVRKVLKNLDESEKPNLVIVSGDITWQGKPNGFLEATNWLRSILEDLKLDSSKLIVCAGNHDINRDETTGMTPPTSAHDADDWLRVEKYSNFVRPFNDFNDYCLKFPIEEMQIADHKSYLVGRREELGLNIIILNSSWFCRDNNDRGKLWLGLPQLQLMVASNQLPKKDELDKSPITISLVHHPKEWFNDADQHTYERPAAYGYLAERSHLIFSGHVHAAPEAPNQIQGKAYVIQGGASYAGSQYRNNFSIVQIDTEQRKVKQIPFEFDARDEEWIRRAREYSFFLSENEKQNTLKRSDSIVWNVPFRQHSNFIGRDVEMDELRNKLTTVGSVSLIQSISGLGGIGKTQLATEYAYKYRNSYSVIWWIRAEDSTTIVQDLEDLCHSLSLPTRDEQGNSMTLLVLNAWLQKESDWLLIFDNATNEKDLLKYIPSLSKGSVLITSRNPDWQSTLTLNVLSRESSIQFLLEQTLSENRETAEVLADELGYLPLALEQACAYIRQASLSLSSYLTLYTKYKSAMLKRGNSYNYETNVAATWKISFDQIKNEFPISQSFIEFCAFLHPDNISRSLFINETHEIVEGLLDGKLDSILDLNDIIARLRSYSLFNVEEDAFSIHRLVKTIIIDSMSDENRIKTINQAATFISSKFYNTQNVDTFMDELNHVQSIITHAEELKVISPTILKMKKSIVGFFVVINDFESAEELLVKCIDESKSFYGENHTFNAELYQELGIIYSRIGMPIDARQQFNKALSIGGLSAEIKINVLNSLANLDRDSGQLSSAFELLKQALDYEINDDEIKATLSNSMGLVLSGMGQFKEAIKLYEDAIIVMDKNATENALQISSGLSNIGLLHQDNSDNDKAIEYFLKSVQIVTKFFGEINPSLARDYNNLGLSYYYKLDLVRSKRYFRKSLRMNIELYGTNNVHVARILHNLGMVFESEGNYKEAEKNYEDALEINKTLYGTENHHVAAGLYNLGGVLMSMGLYKKATTYLEEALALDKIVYGDSHPEVAKDLGKLGSLKLRTKDYKNSLKLFLESKFMFENIGLDNHLEYIACIFNLGQLYLFLDKLILSKKFLEESIKRMVEKDHPQAQNFLDSTIDLFEYTGLIEKEQIFIIKLKKMVG